MSEDEAELDDRLKALHSDADVVQTQIKITNAAERRFFATAYFWWREARNDPDYLPRTFAAANIKFNKTKNRINWRPLLQLVTNTNISKTDLDIWSKAFVRIDQEVSENLAHYEHDPIGQLDYFIKVNRGKTGLAGYHDKNDDDGLEDGSEEDEERALQALLFDLDDDEFEPVFLQLAKRHYSSSQPIASITPTTAKIDAGQFGVAIIRPDGTAPSIVASTAISKLVDQVLVEAYRDDFTAAPPSVRAIAEMLHIANIPHSVSRSSDRFIEYAKAQLDAGPKQTVKAAKRLIYRSATNDMLLSQVHVKSSVCIVATPKSGLIPVSSTDVLLPPYVRRSVEVKLLHQRLMNMFKPANNGGLPATPQSSITHCSTPLIVKSEIIEHIEAAGISERQAKNYIRDLTHPSLVFVPFFEAPTVAQADVNLSEFLPTWELQVDCRWMQSAVAAFFDEWIVEYGIKANRSVNKVLSVSLSSNDMIIGYEYGREMGFSEAKVLPFAPHMAKGSVQLVMRSVDFAFVLKQISSLPLIGNIVLAANSDMLSVECETEVSTYKVYIPACDETGTRSGKCFTSYTPTALPSSPFEKYEQSAEGEH